MRLVADHIWHSRFKGLLVLHAHIARAYDTTAIGAFWKNMLCRKIGSAGRLLSVMTCLKLDGDGEVVACRP